MELLKVPSAVVERSRKVTLVVDVASETQLMDSMSPVCQVSPPLGEVIAKNGGGEQHDHWTEDASPGDRSLRVSHSYPLRTRPNQPDSRVAILPMRSKCAHQ